LGVACRFTANHPAVLEAASLSAKRFMTGAPADPHAMQIHLIVRDQITSPIPDDLPERLAYSGVGDWITVAAGEWGHGFARLSAREAHLFLSPALAADLRFVSRYFIDHYLLNFLLTDWAMLHASCVVKDNVLLMLVAPHNVGKSTTALRLLRAGYMFLADGMALLKESGKELLVSGYPIGEVKLRDDVLALFPEYTGQRAHVRDAIAREHRKTVVDLRQTHPGELVEVLFTPAAIHVCLAERNTQHATRLTALAPADAAPTLAANTVFWDEAPRLAHNTAVLNHLMHTAHVHRLSIGTHPAHLIATLETLL
jgi:hypothetical protein